MLTDDEILSASPEAARKMLAEVTSRLPLLVARASEPSNRHEGDRLLEIAEAAPMLGFKNVKSLYRAAGRYPFTVRDGGRIKFSEKGLREWIARRVRE